MFDRIIDEVSVELGLDRRLVRAVGMSYFRFLRSCMSSLPIRSDMSKEEFDGLATNFVIPYFGRFFCNYRRVMKILDITHNKKRRYDKHKKDNSDVLIGSDDKGQV